MITDRIDNVETVTEQDDILSPVVERFCNVLDQRIRQMLNEEKRSPVSGFLTVEEVVKELKVSKSVVYRWIANGELKVYNFGEGNGKMMQRGFYRVLRSDLDEFIASKRATGPLIIEKPKPVKRLPRVKNYLGL